MMSTSFRGRVAWRHPDDDADDGVAGVCFADHSWLTGWCVVWSPDSIGFMGGGNWEKHVSRFVALDPAGEQILAFVRERREHGTDDDRGVGSPGVDACARHCVCQAPTLRAAWPG